MISKAIKRRYHDASYQYQYQYYHLHQLPSVTRGNSFKLLNQRFYYDIRKYSFIPRIINTWNSLPDLVVNVDSIDIFKNRLDTFWSDQEILFDYTGEITGIGDRSEFISLN